jgi:hypothetical protein
MDKELKAPLVGQALAILNEAHKYAGELVCVFMSAIGIDRS